MLVYGILLFILTVSHLFLVHQVTALRLEVNHLGGRLVTHQHRTDGTVMYASRSPL
jgi:hypothetical protein